MCILNTQTLLIWENVHVQAMEFIQIEEMQIFDLQLKDNKASTITAILALLKIPYAKKKEVCMRVFSCECLCIFHLG